MLVEVVGGVSMDEMQALTMYKLWFGNMNDAMFGKDKPETKRRKAIKSDWETHRMPRMRSHIKFDVGIAEEEFEMLAWGHIPEEMEDRWFMYFDGEAFCFYRSWTGFCIFRVYVERAKEGDGYVLTRITANRCKEQCTEENDERDGLLVLILVGQALGWPNMDPAWEKYFAMEG